MKKKIKYKININGTIIETIMVDTETLIEILQEWEPENKLLPAGAFVPRIMGIFIDEDQCESQMYATWMHEVLEAINFLYHLKLDHDTIIRLEGALASMDIDIKGVKE